VVVLAGSAEATIVTLTDGQISFQLVDDGGPFSGPGFFGYFSAPYPSPFDARSAFGTGTVSLTVPLSSANLSLGIFHLDDESFCVWLLVPTCGRLTFTSPPR
jgi:hypothetical protein